MKRKLIEYAKRQNIPTATLIDILEIFRDETKDICALENGYPSVDEYSKIIKGCRNYDDAFDAGVLFAQKEIKKSFIKLLE